MHNLKSGSMCYVTLLYQPICVLNEWVVFKIHSILFHQQKRSLILWIMHIQFDSRALILCAHGFFSSFVFVCVAHFNKFSKEKKKTDQNFVRLCVYRDEYSLWLGVSISFNYIKLSSQMSTESDIIDFLFAVAAFSFKMALFTIHFAEWFHPA